MEKSPYGKTVLKLLLKAMRGSENFAQNVGPGVSSLWEDSNICSENFSKLKTFIFER